MLTLHIEPTDKVVAACRKEARRLFPKECFLYLLGRAGGDTVLIEGVYIPEDVEKYGRKGVVYPQRRWLEDADEAAKDEGLSVVGWLHSHCYRANRSYTDCAPSGTDLRQGSAGIEGICRVIEYKSGKLLASVAFFAPSPALDVRVVHDLQGA